MARYAGKNPPPRHDLRPIRLIPRPLDPYDLGWDHASSIGQRLPLLIQTDVNRDDLSLAYRHGSGQFDAQPGRGDVAGLSTEVSRRHRLEDLQRPILADAQSAAALGGDGFGARRTVTLGLCDLQHGVIPWLETTSDFHIGYRNAPVGIERKFTFFPAQSL